MTDKSQTSDTAAEAAPALKPLPQLKVLRDTYCSQEMTDNCIRYLEEHRPDLVQEMLEHVATDDYHRIDNCSRQIFGFIILEASKEIETPSSRLGRIDLLAEMFRRFYRSCGKSSVDNLLRPLAEGPGLPLPPLGPIKHQYNFHFGVTMEVVEQALPLVYERRPDLLYELSEEHRRGLLFSEAQADLYRFLENAVKNELKAVVEKTLGAETAIPIEFLVEIRTFIMNHVVQMLKSVQ